MSVNTVPEIVKKMAAVASISAQHNLWAAAELAISALKQPSLKTPVLPALLCAAKGLNVKTI